MEAIALFVRVLVRGASVLVSVLSVVVRGVGMLLGRFVLTHLVVVGRLQMMVGGGRMMGGGLMMVLGRGVLA